MLGYSTFLPTIINDLGSWSTAEVQLLTVPCYFLGAAAYMSMAFVSDRLRMRGVFCVVFGTISAVGYAVLLSDSAPGVHYFACFLVAGGLYVGYQAGGKQPRLGSEESPRKSIGARARDTATRGVLSLWRWNRTRKKKARTEARERDRE